MNFYLKDVEACQVGLVQARAVTSLTLIRPISQFRRRLTHSSWRHKL